MEKGASSSSSRSSSRSSSAKKRKGLSKTRRICSVESSIENKNESEIELLENKIRVKIESSEKNPIVISFPGVVPHGLLQYEQQQKQQEYEDDDNYDLMEEEDKDLPMFEYQVERRTQPNVNTGSALRVRKGQMTTTTTKTKTENVFTVKGADATCSYESTILTPSATATSNSRSKSNTFSCQQQPQQPLQPLQPRRLSKFYVGIFDRENGSLSLHPTAPNGQIFSLTQQVPAYQQQQQQQQLQSQYSLLSSSLTNEQRQHLVIQTFGSVRRKRQLQSKTAGKVQADDMVGTGDGMMNALVNEGRNTLLSKRNRTSIMGLDLPKQNQKRHKHDHDQQQDDGITQDAVAQSYEEARKSILPPYNRTATEPHHIYNVSDMAGPEAWDQLSRFVSACLLRNNHSNWRQTLLGKSSNNHTSSSSSPLPTIQLLFDGITIPSNNLDTIQPQIKAILFLHYITQFHTSLLLIFKSSSSRTQSIRCSNPEDALRRFQLPFNDVGKRILSLFTTPTTPNTRSNTTSTTSSNISYAITKQLRDRRLAYMLLLYVICHGRDMKIGNVSNFCHDIHLDLVEAGYMYRQAGFMIRRGPTVIETTKEQQEKAALGAADEEEGMIKNKRMISGTLSVSLNVPLTFPPPPLRRKHTAR